MTSITAHLTSLTSKISSYEAAISHEFLISAASHTLEHDRLAFWLAQDRIYAAHAYPRFIGSLISRIPYRSDHHVTSPEEVLNELTLKVLVSCLENITREVIFFKETAAKHGLDIDGWKERKETRDYTAEMARVAHSESYEEGLVFLWAMEKVYYDAWSRVAQGLQEAPNPSRTSSAVSAFANNWSSSEFKTFLDDLALVVDSLPALSSPSSPLWKNAEQVWERVVELEATFWPMQGEEKGMRRP